MPNRPLERVLKSQQYRKDRFVPDHDLVALLGGALPI
jgi:hypothetical protein